MIIIILISIFVSFSNIYAKNDNDTFLVGYWQNNKNQNFQDENFIIDTEFKETDDSTNVQILSNDNDGLLGEVIEAKRAIGSSDPESSEEVKVYTVKDGDTIGQIAQDFNVSINTILWANEIESVTALKPGSTLFILPTSGVTHKVKRNETISQIAKKYEADEQQIIAFNELPANGELKENQEIIIPGGEKEMPTALVPRRNYTTEETVINTGTKGISVVKYSSKRQSWNHFPAGYCTYYVAQRVKVTWRGNAGAWLYNAKAQGYKTGKDPKPGSIMVSTEDARYGHVAFVESVSGSTFVVSEMNWKGFNVVNKRTISKNAGFIKGFVYP